MSRQSTYAPRSVFSRLLDAILTTDCFSDRRFRRPTPEARVQSFSSRNRCRNTEACCLQASLTPSAQTVRKKRIAVISSHACLIETRAVCSARQRSCRARRNLLWRLGPLHFCCSVARRKSAWMFVIGAVLWPAETETESQAGAATVARAPD